MQTIPNTNFQVQVWFQSDMEIGNQDEGILVQQDATDSQVPSGGNVAGVNLHKA
jgi:hypothetical protein